MEAEKMSSKYIDAVEYAINQLKAARFNVFEEMRY